MRSGSGMGGGAEEGSTYIDDVEGSCREGKYFDDDDEDVVEGHHEGQGRGGKYFDDDDEDVVEGHHKGQYQHKTFRVSSLG